MSTLIDWVGINKISAQQAIHNTMASPTAAVKTAAPLAGGELLICRPFVVSLQYGRQYTLGEDYAAVKVQMLIAIEVMKVGCVDVFEDYV